MISVPKSRSVPSRTWCLWSRAENEGWDISPSKGNSLLRFLLVEAAQVTSRTIPEWRSKYIHLTMRRGRKIAMVRKLATRLFWMMRQGWNYEQVMRLLSHWTARKSPRCALEHRLIDWACRSSFHTPALFREAILHQPRHENHYSGLGKWIRASR